MSTLKKRSKYTKAINKGKDAFIEALAVCSEGDRFLISDNLTEKVCKRAHFSDRRYKRYYGSIADNSGNVYTKENKLVTHVLADMVFREEKYYLDLIREYNQEAQHNEDTRCTYVERITEHVAKEYRKYLFEAKSNRMNLFLLFANAILVIYDRILKTGLPKSMADIAENRYSLPLERIYLRWAEKEFCAEYQALVQAEIYRIMGR